MYKKPLILLMREDDFNESEFAQILNWLNEYFYLNKIKHDFNKPRWSWTYSNTHTILNLYEKIDPEALVFLKLKFGFTSVV